MMTRKETAIAIAMAMVVATAAVHQEATAILIISHRADVTAVAATFA